MQTTHKFSIKALLRKTAIFTTISALIGATAVTAHWQSRMRQLLQGKRCEDVFLVWLIEKTEQKNSTWLPTSRDVYVSRILLNAESGTRRHPTGTLAAHDLRMGWLTTSRQKIDLFCFLVPNSRGLDGVAQTHFGKPIEQLSDVEKAQLVLGVEHGWVKGFDQFHDRAEELVERFHKERMIAR
jgi:hypothetical protein